MSHAFPTAADHTAVPELCVWGVMGSRQTAKGEAEAGSEGREGGAPGRGDFEGGTWEGSRCEDGMRTSVLAYNVARRQLAI